MIRGIGIDLTECRRFRTRTLPGIYKQFLSAREIKTKRRSFRIKSFAVKEAVFKALGIGLHYGSFWQDVTIGPRGCLRIAPRLEAFAGPKKRTLLHYATARTKNHALAAVIREDRQ